jgi:hypothetical protein
MIGHRVVVCVVLVYLTLDLSLPMMPGVFEFDTCVDGARESRTLVGGIGIVRPEPAVDPPGPKPLAVAVRDIVAVQHNAPAHPVAFRRPRAQLARATLDVGDLPSSVASL